MKHCLIRYSFIGSMVLLLLSGCAVRQLSLSEAQTPGKRAMVKTPFPFQHTQWVYKTSMNLPLSSISGLLVIRPVSEDNYRVIFLNELGMKFFDIGIGRNGFMVYQCFESLQKKSLLRILEEAFNTLLLFDPDRTENALFSCPDSQLSVYVMDANGKNFCFISNETGEVKEIIRYRTGRKRLTIRFDGYDGVPGDIQCSFHKKKTGFKLSRLKNQLSDDPLEYFLYNRAQSF